MIDQIVTWATGIIQDLGYLGVFVLMTLEACCLPIPSEAILLTAGFLVGEGKFTLSLLLITGIGGALTGSTISYCIGRFGGRPLLARYGRFIFLTESRLDATEAWFLRHGAKAVFICRLVSGMRAIISIPAGLCHMSYPKFLAYTALGSGTWVVTGSLLGMFVGREWKRLSSVGHYLLAALVIGAAAVIIIHHFRQRKAHTAAPATVETREQVEAGE